MVPKMLNYFILIFVFVKLSLSETLVEFLQNSSTYLEVRL